MRSFYLLLVCFLTTFSFLTSSAQISGDKSVCTGSDLTLSTGTGDKGSSYSWDFGDEGTVKNDKGSEQTVSFDKAGRYTISVTIGSKSGDRGGEGGSTTETYTITVTDCCPFVAEINAPDTICLGDYAAVSASNQGGDYSYAWNFGTGGSGSNSGIGTHYVYFNTTGNHTITLTVNETCVCNDCDDAVDTHTIYVKPKPSLTLTKESSSCYYINTDYTFYANASSGANLTWTTSGGTITGSGSTVDIKWASTGDKYVTVTADLDGCTSYRTVLVEIIDNSCPTATINLPDSACQNQYVSYNAGPYEYGVDYSWSLGSNSSPNSSNARTGSVKYSTTGSKTVTLTVSKCGCANSTFTETIYIKETPVADITGPSCGNVDSLMSFSAASNAGTTFDWSTNGGSGSSTTNTIDVSWSSTGNKVLCLTAEKNGCSDQDCHNVAVVSADCPEAFFNLPDTVCQNTNVNIGATDQGFGTDYNWTFENGSPSTGNGISNYVSFNSVGVNEVSLTVSKCNCPSDDLTKSVYVKPATTADVSGPQYGYQDSTITFTTPAVAGATYVWTINGGTGFSTTNSIDVVWSTIGYKSVCVTVSNGGCSSTDCAVIGIIELDCPEAVITGPNTLCVGETGTWEAQDEGCGVTYNWTIGGSSATGLSATGTFGTPGTYPVQLIITPCGCNDCGSDTAIINVTVQPAPDADIVGPTVGEIGVDYTFTTPSGTGYTYVWDTDGGNGSSTTNSIDIDWPTTGIKNVCVTVTAGGCSDQDCHEIEITDPSLDTCDYPAHVDFDQVPLGNWIPGLTLTDNGNTTVTIDTVPSNNAYDQVISSTNYVRNGVFNDTTAYWSQQIDEDGALCFDWNQSIDELNFTVYDLDLITIGPNEAMECFDIEFFNNGNSLTLSNNEYTIGQYVSASNTGNVYTFCNKQENVSNTEDFGDVNFDLIQQVDSFKIAFSTESGNTINSTADLGISDLFHCSTVPVPVEWLFIDAIKHGEGSKVLWATAQEVNNSHFIIEKSIDGKNYTEIGQVMGSGNTTTTTDYHFDDINVTTAVTYYRIKQVDFDGQYDYSGIAVYTIGLTNVTLFPNPARDAVKVLISDNANIDIITVYDIFGHVVDKVEVTNGRNAVDLDVAKYRAGVYFVNYTANGVVNSQRLLVTK